MENQNGAATYTRWYAWAYPQIKWFNFIPTFGNGNTKSRFLRWIIALKSKQHQDFIYYQESLNNKVMEEANTPFMTSVKLMDTGYQEIKN